MKKIAYVMSRFPQLTETFILREMSSLTKHGWEIEIFPLIFQQESTIHDEAVIWAKKAHKPVWQDILRSNIRFLSQQPVKYFSIFWEIFTGNLPSPKFLARSVYLFPKAVWMAYRMQSVGVCHIHAHFATHPALAAWIICQISGITYSVTVHAHDIFVDKTMLAKKMADAKAVVAISEYNRKYLIDCLGAWVGDKISVIHCGIEPSKYAKKVPVTDGLSKKKFNILSIGSLQPYKGFSYLLEACVILKESGVSFYCRIVGAGELMVDLAAQIKRLQLEGYVELLGPKKQEEVPALLFEADCYVQPSVITSTGKMEGIPVSLMEAMASGLPVVATNLSGIPELVQNEDTGLLVQPKDPAELAEALMKLYHDKSLAERLAQNGKQHVASEFNLLINVSDLSIFFQTLLDP